MASRRYQWLFFDADGTLFDFEKAQAIALEQVFRHHDIPYTAAHLTAFRQINAELWQALEQRQVTPEVLKVRRFELLLATVGAQHASGSFGEVYLQYLGACPELIEGAAELLQVLRGKYRIAILTNGLRAVQRSRLARSTIRDHVSDIIVSEEIGFAKPAREYFDVAFARAGNPARHEVLMIGDSWNSDIQGAAQYGIDTCWYNPGRQPRPASPEITHEIAALEELPSWLGEGAG
ncbi:MAG TPA: YjjG family noncanonical pyrimidine nucleotidase [Verrucomicrobiae bacterium]|nr:YjjG family noncanonical pyrimidine nucleotidase [Verrucomicrobiae bacterium]